MRRVPCAGSESAGNGRAIAMTPKPVANRRHRTQRQRLTEPLTQERETWDAEDDSQPESTK